MEKIDLPTAQTNTDLRQAYLEGLDLGWARPYIAGILYDPHLQQTLARNQLPPEAKKGIKDHQSTIIVGPRFFDPNIIQNDDDALSVIRDHEGAHGRQGFKNPSVYFYDWETEGHLRQRKYLITERQAIREQFRKILELGMKPSSGFVGEIQKKNEDIKRDLKKFRSERNAEKRKTPEQLQKERELKIAQEQADQEAEGYLLAQAKRRRAGKSRQEFDEYIAEKIKSAKQSEEDNP